MSAEPVSQDLGRPREWLVATRVQEANGSETPLPQHAAHLLADYAGLFPAELNTWEQAILARERRLEGFEAWYRNPSRATPESLGAVYRSETGYKIVRPDFIFLARQPDGTVVADLVDPHGAHLSDALPKIRGLAEYAEAHPGVLRRIETVSEIDDELRVLDLTDRLVRAAVTSASSALELYRSALARPY
jgi:type III restriction enzyme